MYSELKALFGKEKPSVRKFNTKLSKLSAEEQAFYRMAAYKAAFCEWGKLSGMYRTFIHDLFTRDWQQTLVFLRDETVLGTLTYPLREPDLLQRFVGLVEGKSPDYKMPSSVHLAFSLSLAFVFPYKVEYLGDKLREKKLTAEDIETLIHMTPLDNESGHKAFCELNLNKREKGAL